MVLKSELLPLPPQHYKFCITALLYHYSGMCRWCSDTKSDKSAHLCLLHVMFSTPCRGLHALFWICESGSEFWPEQLACSPSSCSSSLSNLSLFSVYVYSVKIYNQPMSDCSSCLAPMRAQEELNLSLQMLVSGLPYAIVLIYLFTACLLFLIDWPYCHMKYF